MRIEVNQNKLESRDTYGTKDALLIVTPPIGEDFWLMRIPLSDKQAIVCFPKFMTIGIGFQQEEDWNTNLPYTCSAERIFNHIKHNKADETILDTDCIEAIKILQAEINILIIDKN